VALKYYETYIDIVIHPLHHHDLEHKTEKLLQICCRENNARAEFRGFGQKQILDNGVISHEHEQKYIFVPWADPKPRPRN
jgi:hypothetical protein